MTALIGLAHTGGFLHLGQSRRRAAAVNMSGSQTCRPGLTAASTGTPSKAEEPRPNHKINNPVYTDTLTSSPPTPIEALQLAQQATLETRDAKHEPRSLAEQRASWHKQAAETLGGPVAVQAMIDRTLHPTTASRLPVNGAWVSTTAGLVLAALEERRSTWQSWHVRAEAQRQTRAADVSIAKVDELVDRVVAEVLNTRSVSLARPAEAITEPAALRRSDGSSMYTVAGSDVFTSTRILAAEQRVVAVAGRRDGRAAPAGIVELALLEQAANGITLDAGQAALVRSMSMSGARLQLAIAPAGAGKTTALRALTRAWIDSGGQCSVSHPQPQQPPSSARASVRRPTR